MYELANVTLRESDTFKIPSRTVRENIPLGHHAKLIFESESPPRGERMWVRVNRRYQNESGAVSYLGMLDNKPVDFADCLSLGSEIKFGPEHICAIEE